MEGYELINEILAKCDNDQKNIINSNNQRNSLISAGAGSGKTFVLNKRILFKIIRGELRVDQLLMLTFTEKAATSMKQKLIDDINQALNHLENDKYRSAEYQRLQEALHYMPQADISTLHSFCHKIVKENISYLISLCSKYHPSSFYNRSFTILSEDNDFNFDSVTEIVFNQSLEEMYSFFPDEQEFLEAISSKEMNDQKEALLCLYEKHNKEVYFQNEKNSKEAYFKNIDDFIEKSQSFYCFTDIYAKSCLKLFAEQKSDGDSQNATSFLKLFLNLYYNLRGRSDYLKYLNTLEKKSLVNIENILISPIFKSYIFSFIKYWNSDKRLAYLLSFNPDLMETRKEQLQKLAEIPMEFRNKSLNSYDFKNYKKLTQADGKKINERKAKNQELLDKIWDFLNILFDIDRILETHKLILTQTVSADSWNQLKINLDILDHSSLECLLSDIGSCNSRLQKLSRINGINFKTKESIEDAESYFKEQILKFIQVNNNFFSYFSYGEKRREQDYAFFDLSVADYYNFYRIQYRLSIILSDLLKLFDYNFNQYKISNNIMDFDDLQHYAAYLLKIDEINKEYISLIKEIYVDEYQDTSHIQESFLEAVQSKSENLKIFMVGDVKQSIYAFRNADYKIFTDKEGSYRNFNDKKLKNQWDYHGADLYFSMNTNYRSDANIISLINHIFLRILNSGDINYEKHLIKADKYDVSLNKDDNCNFNLILNVNNADNIKKNEEVFEKLLLKKFPDQEQFSEQNIAQVREDLKLKLKKQHIERQYGYTKLVKQIKEKIQDFERIKAADDSKTVEPKIAIISRKKSVLQDFAQVLQQENISFSFQDFNLEKDKIRTEDYEIRQFEALFKILDNPKQDYPLYTVLQSDFFYKKLKLSLDELLFLKLLAARASLKNENLYFHNLVLHFKNYDFSVFVKDDESKLYDSLQYKITTFIKNIDKLRFASQQLNVYDLFLLTVASSDIESVLGNEKFLKLSDIFYQFTQAALNLNQTIENLQHITFGREKKSDKTWIELMTIHASKGLEFDYVYLLGADKSIDLSQENTNTFYMDDQFGMILTLTDIPRILSMEEDIKYLKNIIKQQETLDSSSKYYLGPKISNSTALKYTRTVQDIFLQSLKEKLYLEKLEEEKRLLYVAMTRAVKELNIVGDCDSLFENETFLDGSIKASYLTWIINSLDSEILEKCRKFYLDADNIEQIFSDKPLYLSLNKKLEFDDKLKSVDTKSLSKSKIKCDIFNNKLEFLKTYINQHEVKEKNTVKEEVVNNDVIDNTLSYMKVQLLDKEKMKYCEQIYHDLNEFRKKQADLALISLPAKTTVSILKRELQEENNYYKSQSNLNINFTKLRSLSSCKTIVERELRDANKKELKPEVLGTVLHKLFYLLSFQDILDTYYEQFYELYNDHLTDDFLIEKLLVWQDKNDIVKIKANLENYFKQISSLYLSKEEKEIFIYCIDLFLEFLLSPFTYKIYVAEKTKKLYREMPFTISLQNGLLVQGCIDLWFIYGGEAYLLDYKSDYLLKNLQENINLNKKFCFNKNNITLQQVQKLAEIYNIQLSLYKLALEKTLDHDIKFVYIWHIASGNLIKCENLLTEDDITKGL